MKAKLRFVGNILFIMLLFLVLFSYAMFQGGFVSWFLFYSFLPIFIYHFILLCLPMKRWKVTRIVKQRLLRAGSQADITITIERRFRFPLYYCIVEEIVPSTLNHKYEKDQHITHLNKPENKVYNRKIKRIESIGFQNRISIPYTLKALPRGAHELNQIRVKISDVFGFVKKEHIYNVKDALFVRPNEWNIRFIDANVSYEHGQTAVNSYLLENTNVATGVREYAPGDRFSWIDWKQTAKNQMVMTKEFEQERSNQLLLILDATHPPRLNRAAFEISVELAATLLGKLVTSSLDIDFMTIGEEVRNFSMKESPELREEIHWHLTRIQPQGEVRFAQRLEEALQIQKRLDQVVLMTTDVDELFRDTIQALKQRTSHLVILYIQGSQVMEEKDRKYIQEMQKDGTTLRVLTEKELIMSPLEVNLR
jgi:uncharacterized protein (DUF58 family)